MLQYRKSFILTLLVLTSLAISTCQPVLAADFAPVFKNTILPHEGGFTIARNDPGNWTGGKVGKGKLLGTKYGIAANTYGVELLRQGKTIKGLTIPDAEAIAKRDYWDVNHLGELESQGIAREFCDEIYNMGKGSAKKDTGASELLEKVFKELEWATGHPVPVPPAYTPSTIAWINEYTKDRGNRIAFYNSIRLKRVKFYVNLAKKKPSMRPYILSWADRATD